MMARMRRMASGLAAIALLAAACGPRALAAEETVVGYRGDGTCVFPGSDPPIDWDEQTGRNILWKTPLPHFGHSSPIVVRPASGGPGRVFLTCEPGWKHDFPLLLCLDADTGRILWQREVNHLPVAPVSDAERAEIARTWHDLMARYRQAYGTFYEWLHGDRDAAQKQFEAAGFQFRGYKGGGYGQLRSMRFADADAHKHRMKTLKAAGLELNTWQHNCGMGTHCVGQTFATPVSDGRFVYLATSFHSFSCWDLDGDLRWMRLDHGEFSLRGNDYCKNARSPLLYKDLFISDVGNIVRAFDRRTGELRWSHSYFGSHTIFTPVVITVGGTDVLLCVDAHAFRLPGGEPLDVTGYRQFGASGVVNTDEPDVVFFSGGGEHGGWEGKGQCPTPPPAAVRFRLEGDRLVGTPLWCGIDGEIVREHVGLTYYRGELFHPQGFVVDAATGKLLRGSREKRGPRAVPQTRHLLLVAGDRTYGLREGRRGRHEWEESQIGIAEVYSLDGRKLAESTLTNLPVEGEKRDQVRQTVGYEKWQFSYACPFTIAGDRLYVRCNDYIVCIADTSKARRTEAAAR